MVLGRFDAKNAIRVQFFDSYINNNTRYRGYSRSCDKWAPTLTVAGAHPQESRAHRHGRK